VRWLARYYPISVIVVEDIKAKARPGQRRWNTSFSPLEVGKHWCYGELEKMAPVHKVPGHVTKTLRDAAGLHKSGAKVSDRWDALRGCLRPGQCGGGRSRTADEHPAEHNQARPNERRLQVVGDVADGGELVAGGEERRQAGSSQSAAEQGDPHRASALSRACTRGDKGSKDSVSRRAWTFCVAVFGSASTTCR
jgi:hypothetical protein